LGVPAGSGGTCVEVAVPCSTCEPVRAQAVRRPTLSEWLFIAVVVAVAVMVIVFLGQQATNVLSNLPNGI